MGIGPMPTPFQNPFPTFCTSAMSPYSGTAKLAGQQGWHLISANFNAPWVIRSHWEAYCAGAEAAGRRPDPRTWRVSRTILVTDSHAEAQDFLAEQGNSIRVYYNYLFTQLGRAGAVKIFMPSPTTAEADITLQAAMESMVMAGPARAVTDQLVAFIDEVGPFGGLLAAFHEWDRKPLWKASMQRLAEEVMPRISDYSRGKLARSAAVPAEA
jgi:alkanesulfonate monooxygenase SsuD/methylene tetrahydromethanopterin reductase-like flavin-dependent oxidoreductase (luciferase family)